MTFRNPSRVSAGEEFVYEAHMVIDYRERNRLSRMGIPVVREPYHKLVELPVSNPARTMIEASDRSSEMARRNRG